ncbi:MAG: polymer-forming cytoskeletal protein [Pseudomonadota bacterium]
MAQTVRSGAAVDIDGARGGVIAAGGKVSVTGDVKRGFALMPAVIAAGGSVSVDATINGDVMLAGGDVVFAGAAEDVRLTGGALTIAGAAAGDMSAAGGSVEVSAFADIAGDLSIAAETIDFDGSVAGDAILSGTKISIGENARIAGDLIYGGAAAPEIKPGAAIAGEVKSSGEAAPVQPQEGSEARRRFGVERAYGALFWFVAFGASGALMGVLFPGWMARAAVHGRDGPFGSMAIGLGLLVLTPIVAALSMAIVLGLPFGVLLLGAYGALLFVSFIGAGLGLGHLLFDRSGDASAKLSLFAAGLAIVLIASAAPVVGWLAVVLSAAFGMGVLARGLIGALQTHPAY